MNKKRNKFRINLIIFSILILFAIFLISQFFHPVRFSSIISSGCSGEPNPPCLSQNCNSVTISCKSDLGASGGQCAPASCSITLPKDTCKNLGIKNNQEIDPNDPVNLDSKKSIAINTDKCTLAHELTHTLDAGCPACQSETSAFDVSTSCLEELHSEKCKGKAATKDDCLNLQLYINKNIGAGIFNQCLCSSPPGKDENTYESGTCAKCMQELKDYLDSNNIIYSKDDVGEINSLYCQGKESNK